MPSDETTKKDLENYVEHCRTSGDCPTISEFSRILRSNGSRKASHLADQIEAGARGEGTI